MSKIIIDCSFLFDPAESWDSFGDWENDFSEFLAIKGLEAERVTTANSARQVLLIRKKPADPAPPPPQIGPAAMKIIGGK